MRRFPLPRWLPAILAAMLVMMQATSLAHAAEHGDEPHEHAGIVCTLDALAAQNCAVLPSPPALAPLPDFSAEAAQPVPLLQRAWSRPPGRAPPPRGPPAFRL